MSQDDHRLSQLPSAAIDEERLRAWAHQAAQTATNQKGIGQSVPGLSPTYQALGGVAANAVPKPPSAATVKLQKWISESIGEIASNWVEAVLVRRELLPKLMNLPRQFASGVLGAFVGDANVVVVRFEPSLRVASTSSSPPPGPAAVYTIPQAILDELVAEDVASALDGAAK